MYMKEHCHLLGDLMINIGGIMRKEFDVYYYTLKDVLKYGNFSVKLFDVATLKNIIDTWFSSYIKKEGYYYDGLHVNNLWNLIFAKFQNEFIMKSKKKLNEITPEEIFEAVKEIFIKIQETYPKYDLLLNKLGEENLDLFSPLKNKLTNDSNSKFNDTPQTADSFEGDEYISNYTKIILK